MEIKITRRVKLAEVNNSYCHNWYYLIHGQIVNDSKTYFKRFKFVVWFDSEDLAEAEEQPAEYLEMMIDTFTDLIFDYDDCSAFYNACNDSIQRWNNSRVSA